MKKIWNYKGTKEFSPLSGAWEEQDFTQDLPESKKQTLLCLNTRVGTRFIKKKKKKETLRTAVYIWKFQNTNSDEYILGTRPVSLLYRRGIIILLEASLFNVYDLKETSGQILITKEKISEYFGKARINYKKQVCAHLKKHKRR